MTFDLSKGVVRSIERTGSIAAMPQVAMHDQITPGHPLKRQKETETELRATL
jgi:hypothetical protein